MSKRRGRGEGAINFIADKKLWCARLVVGYDANGLRKRRAVYGKTKQEVQKKLAELQSAAITGTLSDPKRMRLSDYLKHWLEDVVRPTIRRGTYVGYESTIRLHIVPNLGGLQIGKLEPSHVQNLQRQLEELGGSARCRQLVHVLLRKALQQALQWGYVHRNVCDMVKRPRAPKKGMNCWTDKQTSCFLEVAKGDRFYALYVLAFTSGLRQGELFGLQWGDINFSEQFLSVQRTISEVRGTLEVGEPKTGKSRRKVELPEFAIQALKEHRVSMLAEGNHKTWVFCDTVGGPLRKSNFRKRSFMPLMKRSELPEIRFHDFRHTAATLLLLQGVHPKVVQERLGHAQISITLDTYSHVLPSMQREAAEKLNKLFG